MSNLLLTYLVFLTGVNMYETAEKPVSHYEMVVGDRLIEETAEKPLSQYEMVIGEHVRRETVKQHALACMDQLEGWCSREKGSILIDLVLKVKPEVIVEIGVWGGKSFVPMACVLKAYNKGKAYGIDPWSNQASIQYVQNDSNIAYWGKVDHEAVQQALVRKIYEFDLDKHVELIKSTSMDAPPIYNIDILHVDGNHSEETSYYDVMKWVPLVKKGGWIIFDDMTWYENGKFTTARAVEWLNTNCIKIAEFNDACIWGIWAKP